MITELFALPINLKLVAKYHGQKLFSSDDLKKKLIQLIKESPRLKPVLKEVIKLVESNKIIPIFANVGMISHFIRILHAFTEDSNTAAFYSPETNKIYILIDNNINILGYVNNDFMAKLVLHEIIHMVANSKPNYFIVSFKPQLLIFYKELFSIIFKLKDSKKSDLIIEDIYKSMFSSIELNGSIHFKSFRIKFNSLKKYSSFSSIQFDEVLLDYFRIIKFHHTNQEDMIYNNKRYQYILQAPYHVYKSKFGFVPTGQYSIQRFMKSCLQELSMPSEVICTLSEYKLQPEIYNAIKELAK